MTQPSQPVELLTHDEAMRVAESFYRRGATAARNRAMLALMWRCGLRSAEVCRLKLEDVKTDPTLRRVFVQSGKPGVYRCVGIDTWGREVLAQWMLERNHLLWPSSDLLFCTSTGGVVSGQYLRRAFCDAGEWARVEKRVYPHVFRHMFAAESLQRGRTMALISRDLGHADVVITAKYLHQMGEHGAQGFEAVGINVKPAGYRSS